MNIYTSAWDKGLKTTYYLHMKPRHSAEQSTTRVNKSEAMGRRGFAALKDKMVDRQITPTEEVPEILEEKTSSLFASTISPLSPLPKEASVNPVTVSNVSSMAAASMVAEAAPNIILPDDPSDALICEGCQ